MSRFNIILLILWLYYLYLLFSFRYPEEAIVDDDAEVTPETITEEVQEFIDEQEDELIQSTSNYPKQRASSALPDVY